jgi:uncharacterized membrane protein YgdD (TMEM256/DUF423 family)
MNAPRCITVAAVALALAVLLGAFGAHALRDRLSPESLAVYRTAADYHFWHGLGLLGVGALMIAWPQNAWLAWVAGFLIVGLLLFCGGLYLLALGGPPWLGALAPVGGSAFVAGWALLAVCAWQRR